MGKDENSPCVSIVVLAYNDEETIEKCVNSLINQTYRLKEIIVLYDKASRDDTLEIVKKATLANPGVRVVDIPHLNRSKARNLGIRLAHGELVSFAESDGIFDKNYIKNCIRHFGDARVGGVIGRMEVWLSGTLISKCLQIERKMILFNYKPFSAWTYRKSTLERVGGFDGALECAEDRDLAMRVSEMGYEIVYEPSAIWWHKLPSTLRQLIGKSFFYGRKRVAFCRKHSLKRPFLEVALLISYVIALSTSSLFSWSISLLLLLIPVIGNMLRYLLMGLKVVNGLKEVVLLSLLSILSLVRKGTAMLGFIVGYFEG